jgi:hypothetical protein
MFLILQDNTYINITIYTLLIKGILSSSFFLFLIYKLIFIYNFVQDIIRLVVGRLAAGERYFAKCYALKLVHIISRRWYWLHNNLSMYQVRQKYESSHPPEEWR